MKDEILYSCFIEKITQKIPQKTELVDLLCDMLCLSKEAIYRRLRKEVPFTFYEAVTISRQLEIPLDSLDIDNISTLKPFVLNLIEYINPAESDFALMDEMTEIMKSFKESSEAEAAEITNLLPQPLYVTFKYIFKFYLFKWKYESNKSNKAIPYKEIVIDDKLQKSQEEYVKWAKRLHAVYILDKQLFQYLVTDIKYFYSIGLITDEEIFLIKQDLLKILNQIDDWTRTGYFKETGKNINIYISNVNIDTNYIYVATPDYQLTIVKAFILNGIASTDKKMFEEVKSWVQSAKQQSISITVSGEKNRIAFLNEQRTIIESLTSSIKEG